MQSLKPSFRQRARAELELRRRQRSANTTFREFIEVVNPALEFYDHVEKMVRLLQSVADGNIKRLMVFQPPRHGKTELVSRLFPAYFLFRFPKKWVGLCSYGSELAHGLSRNARENYYTSGAKMNEQATAVRQWETIEGGGLWAAGVGGSISGRGMHLGIVDDPIKNAEEAASEKIRDMHQDWWKSTFYTRSEPGAAIVVVQTRWHQLDLAGWLLEQEKEEGIVPQKWHVVNLPAIAEEKEDAQEFPPTCTVEPDDREPGAPLCPERYPADELKRIESSAGPYFWGSLYQQRPVPKEGGNIFSREWFAIVDDESIPYHDIIECRFWDFAGTAKEFSKTGNPDFTAGLAMRYLNGIYYITDILHDRIGPAQILDEVKLITFNDSNSARMNATEYMSRWEVEGGSAGIRESWRFATELRGVDALGVRPRGDKVLRSRPFAAQAKIGNVRLRKAPWNEKFLTEIHGFPLLPHDDMVDAASGAFSALTSRIDIGDGIAQAFRWRS